MPQATLEEISPSIHRQVSVEFLRHAGALAVRANPDAKTPGKGWSPRENNPQLTEALLREAALATYKDNLGIHLCDRLVDLDIDSDEPALITALEIFLPASCHVWGHSSRLRTHRVYQLKEDYDPPSYPILRAIKRISEIKLEIRGGKKESGQYCLLPGSIHPSGEPYLWHDLNAARMSVVSTDIDTVLKAIRLAGAITLLLPHWTEGNRNDLCLALSGFLYRTAKISESLGEEIKFQMTETVAKYFIETLMEMADDDPKDRRNRIKNFEQTWEKAEAGDPVTAGATITKLTGDESLLPKLYLLLSDSPDINILDEFSSRFAIWSGPGIIIDTEASNLGSARPFMTRQQFCNSFGHKWIDSGGKRKLVADLLFFLPTTQRLAGVTFEPGAGQLIETKEGKKINQWCGFAIPPVSQKVLAEEIQPFLNYIFEVICSSEKKVERWVLSWISHIFQSPSMKAGTALVLVGLPGIGKSFLGEHFLIPIIGSHSVTTSSADRAVQGFNALFDNKIYVQCDEAISSKQRVTAARLKSLITDPTLVIEPKGIDPYEKPNHMRMLFTSNEIHDAVFLSDGVHDRRYTVIEVSDVHRNEPGYWRPLVNWARSGDNRAKIHRFLLEYDYEASTIREPLRTAAKVLMQEHSMNIFDKWLSQWVSRRHPLSERVHRHWYDAPIEDSKEVRRDKWPQLINYNILALDLMLDHKYKLTEHQIKKELERRNLKTNQVTSQRLAIREFDEQQKQHITKRVYLYGIPSRRDIEQYLINKYGVEAENEEFEEKFEGISLGNGSDSGKEF